jgi:hypothetical protein
LIQTDDKTNDGAHSPVPGRLRAMDGLRVSGGRLWLPFDAVPAA